MYDPRAALLAIDAHTTEITVYLPMTVAAAFLYFAIAVRIALKQKDNVLYDKWFNAYNHWWVKKSWFALVGTVIFEILMIVHVYQYGHKELWPRLSKRAFGWMLVQTSFALGAMWPLVKVSLGDELFFITVIITAVFSAAAHHHHVAPPVACGSVGGDGAVDHRDAVGPDGGVLASRAVLQADVVLELRRGLHALAAGQHLADVSPARSEVRGGEEAMPATTLTPQGAKGLRLGGA